MRSLSLESIPVNKNMKLLSLLVTLLALSYANRTSNIFSETQILLGRLESVRVNTHNISVDIRIPQDIKNACECKVSFAKHLCDFLMSLKSVTPRNHLKNLYDAVQCKVKKQPDDNCEFTRYQTKLTSENFKKFIQDYIVFTKNWNAHCRTNP